MILLCDTLSYISIIVTLLAIIVTVALAFTIFYNTKIIRDIAKKEAKKTAENVSIKIFEPLYSLLSNINYCKDVIRFIKNANFYFKDLTGDLPSTKENYYKLLFYRNMIESIKNEMNIKFDKRITKEIEQIDDYIETLKDDSVFNEMKNKLNEDLKTFNKK